MSRRMQLWMGICFFALVIIGYISVKWKSKDSFVTTDPNGYIKIVEAAKLANKVQLQDIATIEGKRSHVAALAEAIRLTREGLEMPCIVDDSLRPQDELDTSRYFLCLVRLFRIRAEVAEYENNVAEAHTNYLEYIRLGTVLCYGGNAKDQLRSLAHIKHGITKIYAISNSLDKEQCRESINVISEILAKVEPPETVFRRGLGAAISLNDPMIAPALQRQIEVSKMCKALLEICKTALAIRLHYLKQGNLPENLGALVSGELEELPIDPWTGKPLIYHVNKNTYTLFALGPNGEIKL